MTYDIVDYVFVAFTRVNVPDEEVTLRFEDKEAAATFAMWWRMHGGDEKFAKWCLDQGLNHLVATYD